MPIYSGFSTQEVNQPRTVRTTGAYGGPGGTTANVPIVKKYRLYDQQLVIRDLINALSIRPGEKVGNPSYGCAIWDYLFEPSTPENHSAMETELRRVVALDPRVSLNTVAVSITDNGALFELQITFQPFNEPLTLTLDVDRNSGAISVA